MIEILLALAPYLVFALLFLYVISCIVKESNKRHEERIQAYRGLRGMFNDI